MKFSPIKAQENDFSLTFLLGCNSVNYIAAI